MARGVGDITGAAAIGSVGGTALALLIPALVFWAMSRRLRRQAALEKASLDPTTAPRASGPAALDPRGGDPYRGAAWSERPWCVRRGPRT